MPLKSRLAKLSGTPSQTPFSRVSNLKRFKPTSYTPVLVVFLIIGAFFLGMLIDKVWYLQGGGVPQAGNQQAQGQQQPPAKKFDNSTGKYPVLGDKNAKVTVVEFADFQCPFCEKFFTDITPSLMKDYVNTGKVKFAFRNYAFLGQESTWAAEAASCANEQDKFWDFHDYLYSHQGSENSGAFNKDKLEGFGANLGLDTEKFNQCLESDKYAGDVTADTKAGQDFGVSGTPGTFVNGELIIGAQPYDAFKTSVDKALSGK